MAQDLFTQMGTDPQRWADEFAKRFALLNVRGEFVDTKAIASAWFHALADAAATVRPTLRIGETRRLPLG